MNCICYLELSPNYSEDPFLEKKILQIFISHATLEKEATLQIFSSYFPPHHSYPAPLILTSNTRCGALWGMQNGFQAAKAAAVVATSNTISSTHTNLSAWGGDWSTCAGVYGEPFIPKNHWITSSSPEEIQWNGPAHNFSAQKQGAEFQDATCELFYMLHCLEILGIAEPLKPSFLTLHMCSVPASLWWSEYQQGFASPGWESIET